MDFIYVGCIHPFSFAPAVMKAPKTWNAVLEDLRILRYQFESLASSLEKCQKFASALFDRQAIEPFDLSEQLYSDAYSLSYDIVNIKLARTVNALEKNLNECLKYKEGKDVMLICRLDGLLADVRSISTIAQQSLDFFSVPANALNEKACIGILAVVSNFFIEDEYVQSVIFI